MLVRLAGIVPETIVDGPGIRFTLFAQGCPRRCPGCHNPHTHDFNGGKLYDIDTLLDRIFQNPLLDGVTLSGGEPFCQIEAFTEFARKLNYLNEKSGKSLNIWCYSGYKIEELLIIEHAKELLKEIDVLVDGEYDESQRGIDLKFRGSENQRYVNSKESVKLEKAVIIEEF